MWEWRNDERQRAKERERASERMKKRLRIEESKRVTERGGRLRVKKGKEQSEREKEGAFLRGGRKRKMREAERRTRERVKKRECVGRERERTLAVSAVGLRGPASSVPYLGRQPDYQAPCVCLRGRRLVCVCGEGARSAWARRQQQVWASSLSLSYSLFPSSSAAFSLSLCPLVCCDVELGMLLEV